MRVKMLDKEGIKKYVKLYENILSEHNIIVNNEDLDNIYHLILLIANLDDLYDSTLHSRSVPQERRGFYAGRGYANDNAPDLLSAVGVSLPLGTAGLRQQRRYANESS
jgi:hypothetical protein